MTLINQLPFICVRCVANIAGSRRINTRTRGIGITDTQGKNKKRCSRFVENCNHILPIPIDFNDHKIVQSMVCSVQTFEMIMHPCMEIHWKMEIIKMGLYLLLLCYISFIACVCLCLLNDFQLCFFQLVEVWIQRKFINNSLVIWWVLHLENWPFFSCQKKYSESLRNFGWPIFSE